MASKGLHIIITRIVGLLVLAALAVPVLVQVPSVQTWLTEKATSLLEEVLDGKVSIGGIQIKLGGALAIRDLVLVDGHPYSDDLHSWAPVDTLADIGLITGTLRVEGLLKHEGIHLGRIHIQDGFFHLVSEPNDYKSNISRILKVKPAEAPNPQEKYPVFDVRRIRLDGISFRMNNYIIAMKADDNRSPYGVHFEDMDATVEKLMVNNLKFAYGRMSGTLKRCVISEKRGYRMNSLTAKFAVGTGLTTVSGLHLKDRWSDVTIDDFTMDYNKGTKAFMRFLTDVKLAVSTDNGGHLDIRTISGICGALYGNESVYDLRKIRAEGTIEDIKVRSLQFRELKTGLAGSLECDLGGLPDIQKFTLNGKIHNVSFTPVTGCGFTAYWAKNFKLNIPGQQEFLLNGSVNGLLRDLKINVNLASKDSGSMGVDLLIRYIQDPEGHPITVDGSFHSHNLNVGDICNIDALGNVTMSSRLSLLLADKIPDIKIDSLGISRIDFNGHEYSGISAAGFKQKDKILAHLQSTDSDISFNILADCDGSPDEGDLNLNLAADIEHADLHSLGIDNRSEVSVLSTSINAGIRSKDQGNILGMIDIQDPVLTNESGAHHLGDITTRLLHGDSDSLNLTSRFARIHYDGTSDILQMAKDLKALTLGKGLPALCDGQPEGLECGNSHTTIDFLDSRELLAFIMPDAYIQNGSSITINSDSCNVTASLNSGRMAIGTNYLKNFSLHADNLNGRLTADLKADDIDALGIKFHNSSIAMTADSNSFSTGIHYGIKDKDDSYGDIRLDGMLSKDERNQLSVCIRPFGSTLTIAGEEWRWNDSEISIGSGNIRFNDFYIHSSDKAFKIDGGLSKKSTDSLSVELANLGLDILKKINVSGPDIKGVLHGNALLVSPLEGQYKVLGKIGCDSLSINGSEVGDITLAGKWDDREQAIRVYLENRIAGRKTLTSYTYLYPESNSIKAEAALDGLSPSVVMPFLSGILDEAEGSISGKITADGPLKDLSVKTEGFSLDSVALKLSSTGVSYSLDGPLDINDKGLVLDGIRVSDKSGGHGTLHGIIDISKLSKVYLNAGMEFKDLLFIDCTERAGQSFYGNLAGSGYANIKGPVSKLSIDAQLETSGNGQVHIPLGSSVTSANSNLLTFVKEEVEMDEYETMISSRKEEDVKSTTGDISINATIKATPGVKAVIEIDKSTGNILTAFGEGTVKAFIRPSKDILNLEGKYDITGGSYHFQTAAIINKEFSIQSGSSLSFNGPVKDSRLDVTAHYNLKTSLNTLIADTSSVSSRRAVQCGIHISETINNLKFGFTIDIPDLDPSTKAKVESALNTEDKVQKQFASLLVLGTFLPSEQSGIVNSKNVLYSNVSEVMSGQINSIFQKLDIPVDLGFGYQQNDGGTDIFDVAISTQLFNNRVVINGSVGNRKYKTSSNPYGDVVGDLDIDIKLDKKGQLRATLFSHSADEYTNYLDYSQRNGLGFSYQLEYDRLKYLFMKKDLRPVHQSDSMKVITIPPRPASRDRQSKRQK